MVIALSNHKGGTGKTTTTINLGKALADLGKKVLLIDLDPQGNLSFSMGVDDDATSIVEFMVGFKKFEDIVQHKNGLDVLISNTQSNKNSEVVSKSKNPNFLLKNALEPIKSKYDYILIDCPPAMSVYTINALNVADGVIIPMLLEILSVQGLNQILEEIYNIQLTTNPNLEILGALGTIVNENRNLTYEILEFVRDNYQINVFNNYINNNVKAAEAPSYGKSVIEYAPTSTSAKNYEALAKELLAITKSKVLG